MSEIVPGELPYSSVGADDDEAAVSALRKARGDDFNPNAETAATTEETPADADAAKAQADADEATRKAAETAAAAAKTPEELAAEAAASGEVSKTPEEIAAETAAAEAAKTAATETKVDDKGQMIPKHRYDSVKSRLDEALATVEKLKSGEIPATPPEQRQATPQQQVAALDNALAELDAKVLKAVADNNTAEFAQLRVRERQLLNARNNVVSSSITAQATDALSESTRHDKVVATLEAAFPALNVDSPEFDEGLANRLVELRDVYERAGFPESQAISKAATMLEKELEASVKAKPAAAAKVKTPEEIAAETAAAAKTAADRKADAVAKNVAAANKQPATTGKAGVDSDKKGQGAGKITPSQLSDEEYDALPESKRRELRGDQRVPA